VKELKVHGTPARSYGLIPVESGEGIERHHTQYRLRKRETYRGMWNPVKELKVNSLGVHRPRASEVSNPVKELKVLRSSSRPCWSPQKWNPVKELKVVTELLTVKEWEPWNPVKELKDVSCTKQRIPEVS